VRRTVLLALVLVLAGCGEAAVERPRAEPRAAGPQTAELGWREPYPTRGRERLVFEVESLEVTANGWSARIGVTNSTSVPFSARPSPTQSRYGLMLFESGDLTELEDAASSGGLPLAREAERVEPRPPAVLAPGASWRARIAASGSLPAGTYVRVVFGPLVAQGDPPPEIEPTVVWITDRAYRLRP
jgi:hypothetical protein